MGGLLDRLFGSGGADSSNKSLEELQKIPLPVLKEMYPEYYKQIVQLNPELETSVNLGPSASEGITLDPQYRAAQMGALNKLMDISANDGRDNRFKADASRLQNDINSNLKSNSEAITQNLAMRGQSGGMQEMVAKQLSAQQGANRQAQMGLDLNAQAQERALSALMNQNNVASNMSQNDFGQQMQKANNQDAISRFNAANQQQVMNNNVGYKNNAQAVNAQNTQNTANLNTNTKNDAQKYNLGLGQQNFNNQMAKAGAVSNNYSEKARREDEAKAREAALWGNIAGSAATAYAGGGKK